MTRFLAPGVTFEVADVAAAGLRAVRTDVAGFVGIAASGPVDVPVRVDSWEQFRSAFGSFLPNGLLAYAVKAFFENGGRRAWIVRAGAPVVETVSSGAQPAGGAASAVASAAGFVAGSAVTVTQGEEAHNLLLSRVDSLAGRLVWDRPLPPSLDLASPLAFAAGASAASAVLRDRAGRPTWRLTASSPGGWGGRVGVRLGTRIAAATRTTSAPQPADRASSLAEALTGFETGALVRIAQPPRTGVSGGSPSGEMGAGEPVGAWREVREVDAVLGRVTWSEPLPRAFDLVAAAAGRPLTFEVVELGLTVAVDGRVEEVWPALVPVPGHERSPERTLAASRFLRVIDLQAAAAMPDAPGGPVEPSPWPERLPSSSSGAAAEGAAILLRGGRDGIAALTAPDFVRALEALEAVDEVALAAIPDLHVRPAPAVVRAPRPVPVPDPCDPWKGASPCAGAPSVEPEPPLPAPHLLPGLQVTEAAPLLDLEAIYDVQRRLVEGCEALHDRVALLDPPFEAGGGGGGLREVQAWRRRFDSSFAALYYPWLGVLDPAPSLGAGHRRSLRSVPPSGHVAGLIARTDLALGVHHAPANAELRWVEALGTAQAGGTAADVSEAAQEVLNPLGINCIRAFPGRGIRAYGARTLSSASPWRYLPVRRLFLLIEETLDESLQWTVFEPSGPPLWQAVKQVIGGYLTELWGAGALAGSNPEEAFFVRCDAANNPPAARAEGRLLAEVGIAPTVPAEFVVVRIGRIDGALQVAEGRIAEASGAAPASGGAR